MALAFGRRKGPSISFYVFSSSESAHSTANVHVLVNWSCFYSFLILFS